MKLDRQKTYFVSINCHGCPPFTSNAEHVTLRLLLCVTSGWCLCVLTAVLRASEGLAAGESGGAVDFCSLHGSNAGTKHISIINI